MDFTNSQLVLCRVNSASNIYTALEAAFDVLSEIGGNESAEALAKGVNDPFYRVRLAAVRAAKKLELIPKPDLRV